MLGDKKDMAEEMKECLEDFSSAQEKRAYIQVLFHMGLLKENDELKWEEKMDVH